MRRPKIKSEHRPVRHREGRIRIGGAVPGIATDILDPDGWVWALLASLDGTRSVDQVVADLVHRYPAHSGHDVREAIVDLLNAGYLEDAAEEDPPLTTRQIERYSRTQSLFQWMDRTPRASRWHAQLLLHQARVTVIGLGAVGSTAAWDLVASGIGHLHCVDPDRVEVSNLTRQHLYTEQDDGRLKVDAGIARLRQHNSDVHLTGDASMVDSPGALRALAADCDVLLIAADQPAEIRSWANQACLHTGTAWVHGGYRGPRASVGLYRPGRGPCYDCGYLEHRRLLATLQFLPTTPASDREPSAANAVTGGVAGHLAAHAVISLITGVPALPVNCQFGINLVTLTASGPIGPTAPLPDCPACGRRP